MGFIPGVHFVVGVCAVLAGFIAMSAKKGFSAHKIAGNVFVMSMSLLCFSGFYLSYVRDLQFTYLLSALSLYLVATGWVSVKPNTLTIRWFNTVGLAFVILFTAVCIGFSIFGTLFDWNFPSSEPPYGAYGFIGFCSSLCIASDVKRVKNKEQTKLSGVKRHLIRMSSAMLIAVSIFFLGNNSVLPDVLRNVYFLFSPIVFVILYMLFNLLTFNRTVRRLVGE
jgi:uncharacterized membrane protein